jgi:hypothetical protein
MLFFKFFFIVNLLFILNYANAQNDSINYDEDSIVYVYEDPVTIRKIVKYEETLYRNWFLELSGFYFKFSNFHNICEKCGEYKSAITKSLYPILSNGIGITLSNVSKNRNIVYLMGISYSSYHEIFKYIEGNNLIIRTNNLYNYIDLNMGMGYWLLRKKMKVSILMNGFIISSELIRKSGYTLDYNDVRSVLDIKRANRDASLVLGGKVGFKIIVLNDQRIKLYVEPFSKVNFTSVLKYTQNYYLRRWSTGISFGIIYTL